MCGPCRGLAALISAQVTLTAWAVPALPQTLAQECELADDDCALLQTKVHLSSRIGLTSPSIAARTDDPLEVPTPVRWFHVPKCGTSFLNTLIHVPGTCPGLPASLVVSKDTLGPHMTVAFKSRYGTEENCPGLDVQHLFHTGIGSDYDQAKGRLVTFLRQPEQRMISNFYYGSGQGASDVKEFALMNSTPGCAVKMLVRDGRPCSAHPAPTAGEVALARQRLREGFAFVGITDEWDLSICLFNRMFNNACSADQFQDSHPGPNHSTQAYDTEPLGGVRDEYDGALFEEAQAIFRENLARFQVSMASCESCFRQAARLP